MKKIISKNDAVPEWSKRIERLRIRLGMSQTELGEELQYSAMCGRPEPSSLIHTGWKVRKYPVAGEVFFLTSPAGLKESSRTSKWEFAFATSLALREGQNY